MRTFSDNDYPADHKTNWRVIAGLWPYLKEFKGRVFVAAACLIIAKLATVATPVALKYMVDYLDKSRIKGVDQRGQIYFWLKGAFYDT